MEEKLKYINEQFKSFEHFHKVENKKDKFILWFKGKNKKGNEKFMSLNVPTKNVTVDKSNEAFNVYKQIVTKDVEKLKESE